MIPSPILIAILTLGVFLIGFAVGALRRQGSYRRIRKSEWASAALYYERKYNPHSRRI